MMTGGDQTRGDSTFFLDASTAVSLSLNEVASLAMKAARGAGMSWGLAEEAGFAAVWLAQRGLDGPRFLLEHLNEAEGRAWADLCPEVAAGAWRTRAGGSLCPIALGATLCDHADLPAGRVGAAPIAMGPVDHPVLLLPFLAAIVDRQGSALRLDWNDGTLVVGETPDWPVDAVRALDGADRPTFLLGSHHMSGVTASAAPAPATAPDTIEGLNEFAMRTTVPMSDASRAGAGAAGGDND